MKGKIAILVLSIGLCTACGKAPNVQAEPTMVTTASLQEETTESETKKTMQEIYDEIAEKVEQPDMVALNDNYIANYYGIDLSLLEDYVFINAEDVIYADTIVLMKVKDEASTQVMKDALDTMIEQKKLELENYLPEQYKVVEKSEIVVAGNYVYLVISEKADEIQAVISQYLK